MARSKPIRVGACVLAVGMGLRFLEPAALKAAPQERAERANAAPASDITPTRATTAAPRSRHSSRLNEIQVPPPPLPPPAAAKSPVLGYRRNRSRKRAATNRHRIPAAGTEVVTNRPLLVAYKPVPTAIAQPARAESNPQSSSASDPEAVRIRDELKRLRDDAEARRAFYDDLRRTVERVRGGAARDDSREPKSVSTQPSPSTTQETPDAAHDSPPATHPEDIRPTEPYVPQARLSPSSGSIDRAGYLRVVRWAKANGAPVHLALAVAWMESHLNADAPRGGAGEVGMFQIMPARCVAEGWPARRLNEPEFNAWMGTLLLARYYQEEGSVARAAAKYVAGPGVFNKSYSKDVWAYINWYASAVDSYATYFSRHQA